MGWPCLSVRLSVRMSQVSLLEPIVGQQGIRWLQQWNQLLRNSVIRDHTGKRPKGIVGRHCSAKTVCDHSARMA
jgi:hypothetical protein